MIGQSAPTDALAAYAQRTTTLEARVAELERQASTNVTTASYDSGTFTPTLLGSATNPTLGSGATAAAGWWREGAWVNLEARIVFGTSGTAAGSGTYSVTPPILPDGHVDAFAAVGRGVALDSSTGARRTFTVVLFGSGVAFIGDDGMYTHGTPWAWAASDELQFSARYRWM